MRIIGGKYRGKKLVIPSEDSIRPTIDRVKDAMFSILTPYLRDAACLDLFAGSGALGIECLSRGAKRAVFNDNSADAIKLIKTNLKNIDGDYKIYHLDYLKLLNNLKETFKIIFIDPPFEKLNISEILEVIKQKKLLQKDGVIMIETSKNTNFEISEFYTHKQYFYGSVKLTLLKINH